MAYFGDTVFEVLDQTPQRVAEVAGIGQKRMEWLCQAWGVNTNLHLNETTDKILDPSPGYF